MTGPTSGLGVGLFQDVGDGRVAAGLLELAAAQAALEHALAVQRETLLGVHLPLQRLGDGGEVGAVLVHDAELAPVVVAQQRRHAPYHLRANRNGIWYVKVHTLRTAEQ